MRAVSVAHAKATLCKLLKKAQKGERVTICRHGHPIVDFVRTVEPDPRPPKDNRRPDLKVSFRVQKMGSTTHGILGFLPK